MTDSLEIDVTSPILERILFPSIYNTRIIINNTELNIVGVALREKPTDPTPYPLSPVPRGAPVIFTNNQN